MATPLEDIAAAIKILKDVPARGRLDSNNEDLLEHVAALMRMREPVTAWLEAELLALTPIAIDLDQEHAVLVARSILTPVTGRPGPGQPGPVVDKVRAALRGLIQEADGQ
ncbi:hypothetical protein OG824_31595 [Streptomyces prunicolor]|uniref:hypothetical protein n=1 Tax=Streptomyces prunicolor TaxID=67348 RepID=UPI002252C1CA|nr:hypothetical protein [Streptomyces prunicolor]MCX5239754.1 hypothetical protein [Streptomyces prunicolor]